MQKAYIKGSRVLDGNTAAVTAVITHAPKQLDQQSIASAITHACGTKMVAIAGSFNKLQGSLTQTVVHGAVKVATHVIPYDEKTCPFTSISSNMFLDENEDTWSLRKTAEGKVLVKSNFIDNANDIAEIMQSCSSVQAEQRHGIAKELSALASNVAQVQSTINQGSFVAVAHAGELIYGSVTARVTDGQKEQLAILPTNSPNRILVSESAVMHSENITCGALEGGFESCSGSNTMERLLQYYGKLYANFPDYFAKLEERIRSHAFA